MESFRPDQQEQLQQREDHGRGLGISGHSAVDWGAFQGQMITLTELKISCCYENLAGNWAFASHTQNIYCPLTRRRLPSLILHFVLLWRDEKKGPLLVGSSSWPDSVTPQCVSMSGAWRSFSLWAKRPCTGRVGSDNLFHIRSEFN